MTSVDLAEVENQIVHFTPIKMPPLRRLQTEEPRLLPTWPAPSFHSPLFECTPCELSIRLWSIAMIEFVSYVPSPVFIPLIQQRFIITLTFI